MTANVDTPARELAVDHSEMTIIEKNAPPNFANATEYFEAWRRTSQPNRQFF